MYRKAISITAALVLTSSILSVPATTLARGAGGRGGHGAGFGFHPRATGHRPFLASRAAHFGWQRWWNQRHRDGVGAIYPSVDGGAPYPGDVTGGVPGPLFVPPFVPPTPPEHIGCLARGYEVPGESGGVAHVTVIRC